MHKRAASVRERFTPCSAFLLVKIDAFEPPCPHARWIDTPLRASNMSMSKRSAYVAFAFQEYPALRIQLDSQLDSLGRGVKSDVSPIGPTGQPSVARSWTFPICQ